MLIVIDVQKNYEFAESVVPACLKLIKEAKSKDEYIVLVEYKGEGHTFEKVEDAIIGYHKAIVVQKTCNDGARFISQAFRALPKFPEFEEIRICGVYTTWCVRETARGLAKLFSNTPIKIILDACACFEKESVTEKKIVQLIEGYLNISVVM